MTALAAAALAGCATTTDVMPIGGGAYMVGTNVRGGFTTDTEVKAMSIRRATAFCAGLGRQMVVVGSQSTGVQGWSPQNAEVTFRCDQ